MLRFVLTADGSVTSFTPLNDVGPYPFLKEVGTIRVAARSGSSSSFGATEAPSATVKLQNPAGRVAQLIGNPMRAKGEIFDGTALLFSGFIASIGYGLNIDLALES